MPSLGAFKTAKNLAEALETAQRTKLPILVTYEIPESRIENPVINLTVKNELVYLALDPEDEDLETLLVRFQLRKFRGSLLDHHGNVLKKGLLTSVDMVNAHENLSELIEASRVQFEQRLATGRLRVEHREFKKAVRVLEIFAFAQGFPEAKAGKALYEKAAKVAWSAYEALLAKAPTTDDAVARDAWIKALRKFARAWKGSPAARVAKLEVKVRRARRPE